MTSKQHFLRLALVAAALGAVAALPSHSPACDTDVYAVARMQWRPERYMLILAYQPGLADPAPFEAATAKLELGRRANLDAVAFDLGRPTRWSSERMLQRSLNLWGYPLIVLLDEADAPLERFASLDEARQRLAPPANDGEIVSFGQHPVELRAPAKRILIVTDSRAQVNIAPLADRPGDEEPAAQLVPAGQLAEQWARSIAAQPLVGLDKGQIVDIRQPGEAAPLLEKLNLPTLPVCVLADPDGRVIASFEQPPTAEQIEPLVFGPASEFVRRTLLDPETAMAVLFIYGSDVSRSGKSLAAVRVSTRHAATLNNVRVPVHEVDPNDPREAFLLKQLGFTPGQADPMAVAFIGHCKAMPPMSGLLTSDDLTDHIQVAFHPCGCGVTPRQYGTDLLMGIAERDWPPFDSPLGRQINDLAREADIAGGDDFIRDAALSKFGFSYNTLLLGGLAVAGGLVLLAGLAFILKLNSMKARGA